MTVIFNKNSWHRKVYMFPDDYAPENISLCKYFWTVVIKIVFKGFLLLSFLSFNLTWILGLMHETHSILNIILFVLGCIVTGILLAISIIALAWGVGEGIKKKVISKMHSRRVKIRITDNFFFSFLRSKKEKICPIIQWK